MKAEIAQAILDHVRINITQGFLYTSAQVEEIINKVAMEAEQRGLEKAADIVRRGLEGLMNKKPTTMLTDIADEIRRIGLDK